MYMLVYLLIYEEKKVTKERSPKNSYPKQYEYSD